MEFIVFLAVVLGLSALCAPVALIAQTLREKTWRQHVDHLEQRIRVLEARIEGGEVQRAATQTSATTRRVATPASAMGAPASTAPAVQAVPNEQPEALTRAASEALERLAALREVTATAHAAAEPRLPMQPAVEAAALAPVQPRAVPVAPVRRAVAPPAVPRAPSGAEVMATSLVRLASKNPFASAGVILLLIGVGFLFALLAARNILPPVVRVGLVAAGGLAVFILGLRAEGKRQALAFNLQGCAIAVEFLCALWAYDEYHLITSSEAFVALGLISLLAYVWAALRKSLGHAFIGLIGALATPILTSTGQGTLSSLVLYCVWISLLSIGCGALLGSTMLATVAAAGVFILLELARAASPGDLQILVAGCVVLSLLYTLSALLWCFKNSKMADFERASIILQLIAPPLLICQFISASGHVAIADAALLPAFTAALLLLAAWRIDTVWRVWLLAAASVLGFVGIALHFEGGSQAVSFSAGAMALVLMSQAVRSRLLVGLALLYWIASVVVGMDQLQSHHTLPLDVSTVVALAAAFLQRESAMSWIYLMAAPVLAGAATLDRLDDSTPHILWFMLAWSTISLLVSRLLPWKQLSSSALWVLPAGAAFLCTGDLMGPGSQWLLREGTLLAWFAASAAVVWSMLGVVAAAERVLDAKVCAVVLSAILPVVISVEVVHALSTALISQDTLVLAALSLVWALAALASRQHPKSEARELLTTGSLGLALFFAGAAAMFAPLHLWHEVVLVAAIAISLGVRRSASIISPCVNAVSETIVLVLLAAGLALQLIGEHAHPGFVAFNLLFEEDMQSFVSLLWALSGLVVVVIGSTQKKRSWWIAGGIALMALIAKMFVVDLASLTLPAKVGTFMLVGVLFIALGFFCPLPPSASGRLGENGARAVDGEGEPEPAAL